jgi:ADP-ribosyl-[dinitrogen reductase] hydrolase
LTRNPGRGSIGIPFAPGKHDRHAIRDVGTPGPEFEEHWPARSKRLRQRLDAGENIVVHCRGGLGRAGMISARLLVESGIEPEAAIERVRAARPGAIETLRQEEWVRSGSPRS